MPNATNPLGRGFVAREESVARGDRAEHRAADRFSTAIQQYSLTRTASRKSTQTIKSNRLTIRVISNELFKFLANLARFRKLNLDLPK